jgi:AraC-like DNA-binding protein
MLRCQTLDARIKLQASYSRIMTPVFSLTYQRFADRAELVARPAAPFKPLGLKTILEIIAVSFHSNLPPHLLNPLKPYHIYISIEPPPYLARYKALTGVQFHFLKSGMPELRLVFPDAMLGIPLRTSSEQPPADEREQLDLLKSQIGRTTKCSEWARLILTEAEACQPTAQELADLLSISRRTFERALMAEGVSYRELSRQVRHTRACQQMANPELSLSQIAYHLGYSDLAAFSRAFSALAGSSPSEFRKALLSKNIK